MNQISIFIPTFNAGDLWVECINNVIKQNIDIDNIIVVDSGSTDRTISIAKSYGINVINIEKGTFNHGGTREKFRKKKKSEIIVFLTQDAILLDDNVIEKLTLPIQTGMASVSYARQLPRNGAKFFESFPRDYNYDDKPQIRSIEDINQYGVFTFFCSNSCAAWSNKALDSIGGFKPTLTNEDYFSCAELLRNGFKVAYVPNALVTHSHNYSLIEEFQRMFDTGYVRAERPWIQELVGSANKRGSKYFQQFITQLWFENLLLIPYAFIQSAVKFFGYRIGFVSLKAPKWFKKFCSGQKYFWDSKYYEENR